MRDLMTFLFAAASLMIVVAQPAAADEVEEQIYGSIERIHGDASGFMTAFDRLATAMGGNDHDSVSEMGAYPLTVEANGEVYDIIEPRDLAENFEALVSDDIRRQVARSMLRDLIVNSDGVGFADGGLWMANRCIDGGCNRTEWAIIRISDRDPEDPRGDRQDPDLAAGVSEFPLAAGSWGGKVRAGPGMDHASLGSLPQGARITLLERMPETHIDMPWFRIKTSNGRIGYHWGGIVCGLDRPIDGAFEICDQ